MRSRNWVHTAEQGLVFVGPSRVVNDTVDGRGNFGGCLLLFRSGFGEMGIDQFRGPGLQHFRHAVEDLTAIVGGAFRPARPGFGGRLDSVSHILAGAKGNVCEELALAVVDLVGAVAFGANKRSSDIAFRSFGD